MYLSVGKSFRMHLRAASIQEKFVVKSLYLEGPLYDKFLFLLTKMYPCFIFSSGHPVGITGLPYPFAAATCGFGRVFRSIYTNCFQMSPHSFKVNEYLFHSDPLCRICSFLCLFLYYFRDVFMEKHWKSVIHRSICDYFFEAQNKVSS